MSTENIVKFLQTAYSDENLAALLAHAQDGKLSFYSCCCVAGLPSATHPLQGSVQYLAHEHFPYHPMTLPYPECQLADRVSDEFYVMGEVGDGIHPPTDALRRERLIPLIFAEQERREQATRTKEFVDFAEAITPR